MNKRITSAILAITRRFGVDLVRYAPTDFDEQSRRIFAAVQDSTMTGRERISAVVNAVNYVEANRIEGAFVECGVWKGGSTMAMALALKELGSTARELYLYDTFAGMTAPTAVDGTSANKTFAKTKVSQEASTWCASPLDEVKRNVFSTGYPPDKFHFVEGVVEKTIPATVPTKIALLRLDTDWYESTKHELVHLFPLLAPHGVLIIDDYGHWQGARKATDEYIRENGVCILLNRIDYTGVIGVKT